MSRIMMMTSATAALLMSATALGWGLQAGTRLTLVTSDGAKIVGVGSVEGAELEITLAHDFSGYAVLMVEGPDGTLSTFDVIVEAGGNILVGADGGYSKLSESAAQAGLGFQLAIEAGSEAAPATGGSKTSDGTSQPTGLDLALELANENAAKGLGKAGSRNSDESE